MPAIRDVVHLFTKNKLTEIIEAIDEFDTRCSDEGYTDTGDAWELLRHIKDRLTPLACQHELDPGSVKHIKQAVFSFKCKKCLTMGRALIGEDQVSW